jgi:hypothetical protein
MNGPGDRLGLDAAMKLIVQSIIRRAVAVNALKYFVTMLHGTILA